MNTRHILVDQIYMGVSVCLSVSSKLRRDNGSGSAERFFPTNNLCSDIFFTQLINMTGL